jgi:dUTP pyrophosphatase
MKNKILFAKVKPDAIIPSKREEDGCYDIYACFDDNCIVIEPHTTKLIRTGIASAFSPKYRINCKRERGSTGKYSMTIVSGQIDSGFRGEWFIAINNTSNKYIYIDKSVDKVYENEDTVTYPYTKAIGQFAVEFVPDVDIKETTYEELLTIQSNRGVGELGSSGK